MKATVTGSRRLAGSHVWEVSVTVWTGRIHQLDVSITDMRKYAVTRHGNGWRMVENWLNTDAGKQYLSARLLQRVNKEGQP